MRNKDNIEKMLLYERTLWDKDIELIAGVDEVGRGSLAGPMVVAAVILNAKHLKEYKNFIEKFEPYTKINDSKKLTPKTRLEIERFIHTESICYSLIEVASNDIDEMGLTKCTKYAFKKAVQGLSISPQHIITDAFEVGEIDLASQTNLIGGDTKSISVAAASIVAKVYRDNLMTFYHNTYPKYEMYGFNKHKGYGTKQHLDAIKQHGLSDIHRKSYKLHL